MTPLIAIGFVVGVIGFLLITLNIKRVSQQKRVWLLVGVVAPSLLVQVFLPEGAGPAYALGWMIAMVIMVVAGLSARRLKKS